MMVSRGKGSGIAVLVALLLVQWLPTNAFTVEVGIINKSLPTTVIFSPITGHYQVHADDEEFEITSQDLAYLTYEKGEIRVKTLDGEKGSYSSLIFSATDEGSSFKLKPVVPYGPMRAYDGDLHVSVGNGILSLLNQVELDQYVAGVVKSEVGTGADKEFYKVQAIICRTYAMSNFRRHEEEGYQLCDEVHCQVYGGKCMEVDPSSGLRYAGVEEIVKAAEVTSNVVIVDHDLELIEAAFHANCGGQTSNSEDVWIQHKSYLRSVIDTFCFQGRNSTWQKNISRSKWLGYLSSKFSYPVEDKDERMAAVGFNQPERLVYFCGREQIPLKKIRSQWRLPSAFFSVTGKGDQLTLRGRGYGHGVGLCQQGAMQMAMVGLSYKEMLQHYYRDISLIDMASLKYLLR
jgi:stage II sporulation protein D